MHFEKALADETDKLVNSIIEQGVDGVIGGFPCQDVSLAGKGAGLAGARSGLFWEMECTVRLVRPIYWLMENVAALLARGMGTVLGTVATCGYDAEWDCISAGAVGAPHTRPRIYILAYNRSKSGYERLTPQQIQRQPEFSWCENVRRVEDLPDRPDLYPSKLCGGGDGVAKRLHGIGNGNPPCIIREITKGLRKHI